MHHFPGTFYDYRWSTTLARRDKINTGGTILTTGGPDDSTGITPVPGDYREEEAVVVGPHGALIFTVVAGAPVMPPLPSGPPVVLIGGVGLILSRRASVVLQR